MFAALRRLFATNNSRPESTVDPAPHSDQPKAAEIQLTEALRELRSSLRVEESRLQHESRDRRATDEQRLAEARAFVERTGLHEAMFELQREMWHWPSWLNKHPDAVHALALDLSHVSADESVVDGSTLTRVRFTFRDRACVFEFAQKQGTGAIGRSSSGILRFFAGDEQVLRLSIYHDLEAHREYYQWSLLHVEVIRPGDWMADLLELEHRIRVKQQKSYEDLKTKLTADRAHDLPAPGELGKLDGAKPQRT